MCGAIDDERADLEAFLRRKLAPAPFELPNARVELGGRAGHDDEVVEATRRVDARDLSLGDRDERARLFELRRLPDGPESGNRKVGSLASPSAEKQLR